MKCGRRIYCYMSWIFHTQLEDHIASVNQILSEIDCADKKTLMVFNKIDLYEPEVLDEDDLITPRTSRHYTMEEWHKTWMHKMEGNAVFISALNKENLDEFRKTVYREVRKIHINRFPYNNFLYPENLDEYSGRFRVTCSLEKEQPEKFFHPSPV